MMKKRFTYFIATCFVSLIPAGCLKNKLEPTGEEDVIFSAYDPASDFTQYIKYMVVDEIGKIDLSQTTSTDTLVQEPYRTIILNQIDINLLSYGYIKVDSVDSADVFINLNVLINPTGELIDQYSYVDEDGDYQSVWWANQYYYGATDYWGLNATALYEYQIPSYFTANSGTLMIEMLDVSSLDTANQLIYVPWFAGVRSVLTGDNISTRLVSAINQCFTQSQYLKH